MDWVETLAALSKGKFGETTKSKKKNTSPVIPRFWWITLCALFREVWIQLNTIRFLKNITVSVKMLKMKWGLLLQQNNDPKHTSEILKRGKPKLLTRLSQSPGLHIILNFADRSQKSRAWKTGRESHRCLLPGQSGKNPNARTEGPQASCVYVWSVLSVDYAVQTVVLDSLWLFLSSLKPVLTGGVQDFALHIKKTVYTKRQL